MVAQLNLPKEATFSGPALLWKRVAAFFIDIFILEMVIGFPFRSFFSRLPGGSFSDSYNYLANNPDIAAILSLIMMIFGLLAILYFSILEYKIGQTLGKMLMNIKVAPIKKDINFFMYLVRNIYLLAVFPFVLLWIIDPLFMFFTKERTRLSEVLSKTRTIETYALR